MRHTESPTMAPTSSPTRLSTSTRRIIWATGADSVLEKRSLPWRARRYASTGDMPRQAQMAMISTLAKAIRPATYKQR